MGLMSEVPLQVDVALISVYPSQTRERCAEQEERRGGDESGGVENWERQRSQDFY